MQFSCFNRRLRPEGILLAVTCLHKICLELIEGLVGRDLSAVRLIMEVRHPTKGVTL